MKSAVRRKTFGSALCWLVSSFIIHHSSFSYAQRSAESRPAPLPPAQAKAEAKALVAELLAQKPDQNSTNTGQVKVRDRDDKETDIPARFAIVCTSTNWMSIYQTLNPAGETPKEKLVVIHTDAQRSQYFLTEPASPGSTNVTTRQLAPGQTMVPFAGSDFWVADLGLEFLHWPEQRLLKTDMRHSRACKVLESTDPHPAPGCYSRVVSWVTVDSPHGIVHADAYDAHGELMKQFDPTNLEKINGSYQLAEMEMRNRLTDSHTWIKFDLSH